MLKLNPKYKWIKNGMYMCWQLSSFCLKMPNFLGNHILGSLYNNKSGSLVLQHDGPHFLFI